MRFRRFDTPVIFRLVGIPLLVLLLVAPACSTGTEAEPYLGDGSLGLIEVLNGRQIQIRAFYTNGGDLSLFGNSAEKAIVFAVEDYGPIKGREVNLGAALDDTCTAEGGLAGAQVIVAHGDVAGVIGTNCSIAAAEASPLLTQAGMVLISPGNTAPSLTSDLAGNEGTSHFPERVPRTRSVRPSPLKSAACSLDPRKSA